jgi:formylglycine-generating enzyme required for sulfatase activity
MKSFKFFCSTGPVLAMICSSALSQPAAPKVEKIAAAPEPRLTIQSTVGTTNVIEYTPELATNQWRVLTNWVVSNNPYVFVDLSAPPSPQRFYRVLVPTITNPLPDTNALVGMILIPASSFTMGSPSTEQDRDPDEGPPTQVTISQGFWMSQNPVTQEEYLSVMGNNPSYFTGEMKRPVEQVSWNDATNYCGERTLRERAAGHLPEGYAYRLPTEAEWEYACRAGSLTRFGYGEDPGYTQLGNYAWYDANSSSVTHPVGQKQPNAWGLYDVHGNIYEWCGDWYGTYPGGTVTDPQGPASGSYHVMRGGCWYYGARYCRSANRGSSTPDIRHSSIGFRVLLAPGQ